MNSSRKNVPSRLNHFLSAPWWSRIPVFGVQYYPKSFEQRLVFFASAIIYSLVYIFVLAFALVIFSHSLYGWTSIRDYFITTMYDIFLRHPYTILFLVAVQVILIVRQAKGRFIDRYQTVSISQISFRSAVIVGIVYGMQYVARGSSQLEPNVVITVSAAFVLLVLAQFVVDRLLRKT